MTATEVLVAGVTGQVGSLVAASLLRDHGVRPRGLVRRAAPADSDPLPYRPFVGDLSDPDSLEDSVDGCEAIFVVSPAHPDQRTLQENLIRAALAAGRRPRIVKLSGLGTRAGSFVDSGRWHADTEAMIDRSGLSACFLRPYFFMQNLVPQLRQTRETGVFSGTLDEARVAMVDVRDVAEVAARLLVDPPPGWQRAVPVTGPTAHNHPEIADLIAQALDREVRYERWSDAQLREALERAGLPDWRREMLLQFNRAFELGWAAEPSDTVERALGRPARALAAVLRELGSTLS